MFFDDPLLWELHLLPSHEFDYLHLINLLLQNQYIFPIIQKPFLNSGFFSKFVLLNDHTTYNMENFHFSILSLLSFFFHFFLSFFHSFLPSFLFLSFFSVVSLLSKWTKSAKNTRMNCCSIFGSLKTATLAPAQVMNRSV